MPTSDATTHKPRARFFWARAIKPRSLDWWNWAIVTTLLLAGLADIQGARETAFAIAAAQACIYLFTYRSAVHFPTQVRLVYVTWMAMSFLPGFIFMFWIQLAGTLTLTVTGYCPLARILMLLPVNCRFPLTLERVKRILLHPPTEGSVLEDIRF